MRNEAPCACLLELATRRGGARQEKILRLQEVMADGEGNPADDNTPREQEQQLSEASLEAIVEGVTKRLLDKKEPAAGGLRQSKLELDK